MSDHSNNHDDHGFKPYIIGFILSVVLTAIPFYMVMKGVASMTATFAIISTLAVVQIIVHLKYFLHLTFKTEDGKIDILSFAFTAVLVCITVGLSIWLIYAANYLMM